MPYGMLCALKPTGEASKDNAAEAANIWKIDD